jgi:hypothetical protein
MGREGFEPSTLGLSDGCGSFGEARFTWRNEGLDHFEGSLVSAILGGLGCPIVAHRQSLEEGRIGDVLGKYRIHGYGWADLALGESPTQVVNG